MKVLIVGSNSESAIERFYMKYMEAYGVTMYHYGAYDMVYAYHSRNIVNKILFKTGIRRGYTSVNEGLLAKAAEVRPDIVWIFKGMEIYPRTLVTLKKQGFILVNYNPDHPFILAGKGSGNKNVTDSVGLFDLHFCYHSGLMRDIKQRFNIPTVFLPFGYELPEKDYRLAEKQEEIKCICFIGNPDKIRVAKLNALTRAGLTVHVYGYHWQDTTLKDNADIKLYDAVFGIDFWLLLRRYRVQLNVFREHNAGSHNMRTFEIPAVGGIQLAPFSEEQTAFFEEGKEIFFYRTDEDMVAHAKKLLAMNQSQINEIRAAARARSLVSGYSFADRAKSVLNSFQKLL